MVIFILIIISIVVSEFGMKFHELRRRLSFAPAFVVHLRQPYRFLTWPFIHVSRIHLYTNCGFLLTIAIYGNISEMQAGQMAFMAALLSPIPRMILQKNEWTYKATGISSIIAAYVYFYAIRSSNPYLIGLVAANAVYELVMVFFRPRGTILYDAHLIGAVCGLIIFMIGI